MPLFRVQRTYCNASEGAGSHIGRQREVRWKRFIAEARISNVRPCVCAIVRPRTHILPALPARAYRAPP